MKKTLAIMLTLLMLIPVLTVSAFADAPMSWNIMEDNVLVISGEGEMRDLTDVSAPWKNYDKQILSLEVEDGVTGIGNHAFQALRYMTSATVADSVERIGDGAFANCISLESVVLPSGLKMLNPYVFSHCSKIKSLALPEGLEEIGTFAFNSCSGLEDIYIPASVKDIAESAFAGCWRLKTVYFGGTQEEWDAMYKGEPNKYLLAAELVCEASTQNQADAAEAAEALKPGDIKWSVSKDNVLTISGNGRMSDFTNAVTPWYSKKDSIVKIVVEDGVTHIGSQAFQYFQKVKSVSLPESVTSIGDSAFYECLGLREIVLPSGLTEMGESAFAHCSKLAAVEIPESLTEIPFGAFGECRGITTLKLPGTLTKIGDFAFSACGHIKDVWFDGTPAEWAALAIGEGNEYVTNAFVHTAGTGTAGMAGGVF